MNDKIDQALRLSASSPLYSLRRERAAYVDGTEACRVSVLAPQEDQGIASSLRLALAARMASRIGVPDLAASYRAQFDSADSVLRAISDGEGGVADGDALLKAILRHVDLVTGDPKRCARSDIEALAAAGLTNPQVVAVSELIAFVAYEARVVAGLRLLGGLQ